MDRDDIRRLFEIAVELKQATYDAVRTSPFEERAARLANFNLAHDHYERMRRLLSSRDGDGE